jgi:thiol-disulfide isomerase/thioredoxin
MEAMEPNPAFDPESYPDAIAAFDALGQDARVLVWGGDWCPDTRQELPDVAALLDATELGTAQIEIYEVDGDKQGPKVEEYDVTHIPTIVVERDGEELARFVESEPVPAAVYLADQVASADASA